MAWSDPEWSLWQKRAIGRLPEVYAKKKDRNEALPEGGAATWPSLAEEDLPAGENTGTGNPSAGADDELPPDTSRIAGLLGGLLKPADEVWAKAKWVEDTADLDLCDEPTLELYGGMLGQPRGEVSEKTFRYVLRVAVARNFIDGTHESVLQGIMRVFNVAAKDVTLQDHPNRSGTVQLLQLPFQTVNEAGLTTNQAVALIQRLLPLGVGLEAESFEGTFEFGGPDDYDEQAGFARSEEDQSIGGWLGATAGDSEAPGLPF